MLSIIEGTHDQTRHIESVRCLAAGLEEKETIPAVKAQIQLIHELQTDEFWENVTQTMLEKVRRDLRDLIQFVDRGVRVKNVYTNLSDTLGDLSATGETLVVTDPKLANYHIRMERFLREHASHITIHRIRMNQAVTDEDIRALEAVLFGEDGVGTREDYDCEYQTDDGVMPLGQLIRKVLGMDRPALVEAFNEYLRGTNLNADQLRFLDQVLDYIADHGSVEPSLLFEPPFTDEHPSGVAGVFDPDQAKTVVGAIHAVNDGARVG